MVFVILFCDDEEKWGGWWWWWWWCQWCDCEKNLLTPSCCPFPRAKAEEELWTHSNEQSEVAQREAPKGPSKNKSWPWQKHRHKPSDRGWPFWRGTHVEQLQESESRPRDVQTKWETETQKTQTKKWNTGCQERPSRDSRVISFGQGTAFLAQRWPPAVVCALAEFAWCAHAHWSEIFKRQDGKQQEIQRARFSVCCKRKGKQNFWIKPSVCPSQLCLIYLFCTAMSMWIYRFFSWRWNSSNGFPISSMYLS